MRKLEDLILAYAAAWNEHDEARRRELIAVCWTHTGTVTGPGTHYAGREALSTDIARFHRERPGCRGILTSGLDAHHGFVRFSVAIVDARGHTIAEGVDIGEVGPDGLLARIVTFWGAPPPVPATWPPGLVQ